MPGRDQAGGGRGLVGTGHAEHAQQTLGIAFLFWTLPDSGASHTFSLESRFCMPCGESPQAFFREVLYRRKTGFRGWQVHCAA